MSRFHICAKRTAVAEGGYVNDPKDPGGPTMRGITQATLSGWLGRPASVAEVVAVTEELAHEIYRANYWVPAGCDNLPIGLDYCVFDFAINSGVSRAVKVMQRLVGVREDGIMGVQTLAAIDRSDLSLLIDRYQDARLAFMKSLKIWGRFKNGWTKRVNSVRAIALNEVKGYKAEMPREVGEMLTPKAQDSNVSITGVVSEAKGALAALTGLVTAIASLEGPAMYVAIGATIIGAIYFLKFRR